VCTLDLVRFLYGPDLLVYFCLMNLNQYYRTEFSLEVELHWAKKFPVHVHAEKEN